MLLVSACLAGFKVRYDGQDCMDSTIKKWFDNEEVVSICPELLGGFTTPREPAEIIEGNGEDVLDGFAKVVDKLGRDVTELYLNGAKETLDKAKSVGATAVVLKENSPSCGSSFIYNGKFNGERLDGMGVTTALLRRNGLDVYSENELSKILDIRKE
ncbi:DUF523 domain-containing protein [Alkalihalobacillus sp. 1P02AB]|uniref:DUF523 domain-containing protein n=1 Tax=Alkalihalobacillus sp. 1P02AB TaxID=3132260 RepID=UPI0039A5258C